MLKSKADVILLGATEKDSVKIIRQLRTLGIKKKPIMGGDGIDNPFIWEMSNGNAYNTYVASIYAKDTPNKKNKVSLDFYNKFLSEFGYEPDYLALQGYEAIKILASAIYASNSKVPITLAANLKYNPKSAYKNYRFDNQGRIMNKAIFIKKMDNGHFYRVPTKEN